MRRRILALMIIMIIWLQNIVLAADNSSAAGTYQNRLDILCALGIFPNKTEESDKAVMRAEFIDMILKFTNEHDNLNYSGNIVFADVDKDYPYAPQIERGAERGYMIGYSDGRFAPEANISLIEAAKVLVSALGYSFHAEQNGGDMSAYLSVANSLDILDGVKLTANETVTMNELVTMVFNASECPVMTYDAGNKKYSVNTRKRDEDNNTALYYFHNIAKVKGVVTANDVTGLNSVQSVSRQNNITLDGENMDIGLTDANTMLGYYVTAYVYYEDEHETGVIRYIEPGIRNNVLTVEARDILSEDPSFSGSNFVYESANRSKRTVRIAPDTAVIYNGLAKPLYSISDFAVRLGDVTFIDNDTDGTYDVISIFNATQVIVPEFISDTTDRFMLTDMFDASNRYSYDSDYKHYDVSLDGEPCGYADIKTGMLVLIGDSGVGSSSHSITRVFSSGVRVSGKVTIKSDDSLMIDNTSYDYSPYLDYDKIALNDIGEFWVNNGYVFAFKKGDIEVDGEIIRASDYQYGFMLSAYYATETVAEPMLTLKILDSLNTIEKYETTDNTKFNGKKRKNRGDAAELFAKSRSGDSFIWLPQVVMYKLDSDGNIAEIFTQETPDRKLRFEGRIESKTVKDPATNRDVIRVTKNGLTRTITDTAPFGQYTFYVDTWMNIFYQDENTVVFHINDDDLEASYATEKFPSASTINEGVYDNEFYNIDEDKNTVAVVVWHSTAEADRQQVPRGAYPTVVQSIKKAVNSDDDIVKQIVGITNGTTVTIDYNDKMTEVVKRVFDAVQPGDIIFYQIDGSGKVLSLDRSFINERRGEYGIGNNTNFSELHGVWQEAVHLYRKVAYVKIEEKLHNNFFSYKNGEGIVCIQQVDPAAKFYKIYKQKSKTYTEPITYNDINNGDDVYAMYEFNKLQVMYVIDESE